jgi:hypothetical protein
MHRLVGEDCWRAQRLLRYNSAIVASFVVVK